MLRYVFKLLMASLTLLLALSAPAQQVETTKPIAVLVKQDPWLMVIGSDSPSIAVYDDGLVVLLRSDEVYWSVRLTAAELAALRSQIGLDEALPENGKYFELERATDQPMNVFYLDNGHQKTVFRVYGNLQHSSLSKMLPDQVRQIYTVLDGFDHLDATKWEPEFIEVMAWPYEYAPDKSVIWPSGWPGLDDPGTVQRDEDSYSIYIPYSDRDELIAFLRTQADRGAVEIDGRKMAVSTRFPFPGEAVWMGGASDPE